jgi:hypothetical protein
MKVEFLQEIFLKSSNKNFMKIPPMRAELFHVDAKTGRHDKANSRFLQLCKISAKSPLANSRCNLTKCGTVQTTSVPD